MTSSTAPSAEAIHLLSYDQNIWSLNEDALATIQQCKPPIHSLAIMGKGRSGKSTLLNLICWYFGDEGRGCVPKRFVARGDYGAITEGIWICPIPYRNGTLLVFDTEGYDSLSLNQHSILMKMLGLVFLCSSTVIWNTEKTVDMDNLDKIGVVLEVAKSYDLPVTESKDNLPQLVFLIRDEQFRLPPQCTLAEYFNPIVRDHYIGYKVLKAFSSPGFYAMVAPSERDRDALDAGERLQTSGADFASSFLQFVEALKGDGNLKVKRVPTFVGSNTRQTVDGASMKTLIRTSFECLRQGIPISIKRGVECIYEQQQQQQNGRWKKGVIVAVLVAAAFMYPALVLAVSVIVLILGWEYRREIVRYIV